MSPKLVSVLIVNYRAYPELTSCLESPYPFVIGHLEVVVVDHARAQASAASLRDRFPWIRLAEVAENPGFAAGVNRAARLAIGRYLLFLNPDCVMSHDVPHALASWLQEHPAVAVVGSEVREIDGSVQA